ncbi:right-handed parallel beta-helix repeat-containing protein [Corallococcus sp. M34]|uniref:right-handed parallel beta-helix repeat-containing protein n=1 Tax=Citreicoccus inhibens TaxID=2849499 RepID=UPI001C234F58|nr:right-handed parallel beta-helix repeat-containing protein [Citreicoccus inhibens]MBU8897649.1 right-handed parallel beta-helix repeat-containing protein [Citreicoccus inhibens]
MSTLRSLYLTGALCLTLVGCGQRKDSETRATPTPGNKESPLPSPSPTVPVTPPVTTTPTPPPETPPPVVTPEVPAEPQPQYAHEWYVSPSGNDSASGTRAAPLRTISKALSVVGAGDIIRVQSGTYAEQLLIDDSVAAGTKDARITLRGEGSPHIVPVSGPWAMMQVKRPYWTIEGFDIDGKSQRQVAVAFSGNTEGTLLTGNDIHHGSFGSGVSTDGGAHGITIEKNTIHHFSRDNDDSHGIVITPTSRDITVRDNDIHDNSGDSVQCLGPEGFSNDTPAQGVLIENNHLHDNRENATDIKTCHDVTVRGNRMHGFRNSTTSRGEAVVVHYSAKNVVVENNDISDTSIGVAVGGNRVGPPPNNIRVQRNRIHGVVAPEGSAIRIENGTDVRVLNNTVTDVEGFALVVGHGTGGASTNVTARNNIFAARNAMSLGGQAPGLKLDNNLYAQGANFSTASFFVPGADWVGQSLTVWKQSGQDASSREGGTALADTTTLAPGPSAVDQGVDVGLPFCGAAPDLGAVESGCATTATSTVAGVTE